jgi:hypothetical protein
MVSTDETNLRRKIPCASPSFNVYTPKYNLKNANEFKAKEYTNSNN